MIYLTDSLQGQKEGIHVKGWGKDFSPREEHIPWLCSGERLAGFEERKEYGEWMKDRLAGDEVGGLRGNKLCWTMPAMLDSLVLLKEQWEKATKIIKKEYIIWLNVLKRSLWRMN